MSVPKYYEFFPPFLRCLADEKEHTLSDIREYCAASFNLSPEDRAATLPSGRNILRDRVGWCRTYLKKAHLVESPKKADFVITEDGKKVLAKGDDAITLKYVMDLQEDISDNDPSEESDAVREAVKTQSPQEIIDYAMKRLNSSLADELMSEIMKMSPYDFEILVVKLLEKLGYGSEKVSSTVTKKSGDEGIDGIVLADRFGFDAIYTQAKLWKQDSVVGSPEIQKFLGALAGQGASKGIFITTAKFSNEARNYVKKQLHQKIVLIDGQRLTDLMIECNLGVAVESTYEVKKIDYDFFNE